MGSLHQLERDGVGILVDARGDGLPRVLHWGRALGQLPAEALPAVADAVGRQSAPGTLDAVWQPSALPVEGDGWSGRPAVELRRDGVLGRPRWRDVQVDADGASLVCRAVDERLGAAIEYRLGLETGGVAWVEVALRALRDGLAVERLEPVLPVPSTAAWQTSFDGRWTKEKRPVTTRIPAGSTVRESRRGRPGHDAPTALIAALDEPRFGRGELWAVHAAWPGDTAYRLDRVTEAPTLLGAGELLRGGEVVLGAGEEHRSPRVAFVWSDAGLDGIGDRFHRWMRGRPQHPRSPRPLTLNTWEAVYFDHDPARLAALAELAADLGVERFVLDDGWFAGRRDDTTSLGDWVVDETVWPDGLEPLAALVHARGMQFGLWFEPEMVSLDSDLAREHPDWLLHDEDFRAHDPALSWRSQYVLDLANPDAFAHLLERMSGLVGRLGVDFVKWDHNRDLVDAVHEGRPGVHAQTAAMLALMAELKRRHPGLEIESCSSGGARTDLGVLQVADRVWASDSNDPVERLDIQRWTGLLLPPELVGAHVGPTTAHSSGRTTPLSLRMAVSLLGSAGFEWDLLSCDEAERERIAAFARLYRELREVVHRGRTVRPDLRDDAWRVTGFVVDDATRAVYVVATVSSVDDARPERLRMPGLRPEGIYRVRVRDELGAAEAGWVLPRWLRDGGIELPGAALAEVGLQLPVLWPQQAIVLDVALR